MRRVDFLLPEDSLNFLKSREGTLSEHIRWAIDQYIHKLRQEETRLAQNASSSASLKGGDDGQTTNS
jgi:hypothetical protein